MMCIELRYSNTNTYLIKCDNGYVLFDTGWAGTFPMFCKALGELKISVQDIKYIIISHFHPDHMGIAQEIANIGAKIIVADVQREYIHFADEIFAKDRRINFMPVIDEDIVLVNVEASRNILERLGIQGEIIHTPGHSEDSISLLLDDGSLLVGDLNPLYELECHKGTKIYDSWQRLLERKPKEVYYGHAKSCKLANDNIKEGKEGDSFSDNRSHEEHNQSDTELYSLVKQIIRLVDKGRSLEKIKEKTGASDTFIEDVTRMYLTHQNVGVRGILDRIEIKGK